MILQKYNISLYESFQNTTITEPVMDQFSTQSHGYLNFTIFQICIYSFFFVVVFIFHIKEPTLFIRNECKPQNMYVIRKHQIYAD